MKSRLLNIFIFFVALFIAIIATFFVLLNTYLDVNITIRIWLSSLIGVLSILNLVILLFAFFIIKKKREDIRNSFNYYVEKEVATMGMGVVLYNSNQDVIWISKFVEDRFGNIIGKKIYQLSSEFKTHYTKGKQFFKFTDNGLVFEAKINVKTHAITITDVTNREMIFNQYTSEKLVVGELEIDNFQQFQVTLPEEILFKITSKVIEMMDTLSDKYNLIYRQYVNGKFIFYTNQDSLDNMIKNNFSFLDILRKIKFESGISLSASIGIGSGTTIQKKLSELAREGLTQAQARGGDQVSLMISKEKPKYFGSKKELSQVVSRVKIKQTTELFESRLKDSKIKNVIIYPHIHADLDAIGAALGIAAICDTYKKSWNIQSSLIDETTTEALKDYPKEILSKFIKPLRATKLTSINTLVVIVDTAEMSRIENENALKKVDKNNIFIFDHHRVQKLPKDIAASNVYIDTTASSASEIVTEVMNFIKLKLKISRTVAQMLLNGIYLDTQSFNKSTSGRTYSAASFLENIGASPTISSELLKIPSNASGLIMKIMNNLEEVKKGFFLSVYEGEVASDIIAIVADEILRVQGRKAAFVVAKTIGKKEFKMSARSIDTNIQIIAEAVGGGGHFGASAAVSDEPLPVFVDNIRQAIISDKGE